MKTKEKIVEILADNSYYSKDHKHELRAEDFDEVATLILEQLEPEGEKTACCLCSYYIDNMRKDGEPKQVR